MTEHTARRAAIGIALFALALLAASCGYDGPRITVADLNARLRAKDGAMTVVDVRPKSIFRARHVPGAVNIPLEEVDARAAEIEAIGKPFAVICTCGKRSLDAAKRLRARGLDPILVEGGMQAWERSGFPVEEGR